MFAIFIAWVLIQAGVSYWVVFFLTVGIAFVGGLLVQRIFIKPVE
jgi:branched-chain amino acid transport system permease protein